MPILHHLRNNLAFGLLFLVSSATLLTAAPRELKVEKKPVAVVGSRGIIALPGGGKGKPTGDRGGPVLQIPGGGIGVKPHPKLPVDLGAPLVEAAGGLTVAPAQLQVKNENGLWSLKRNFTAVKTFHFRWSRMEREAASARWELAQHNLIAHPVYPGNRPPAGHPHPQGPTAVLIAAAGLALPPQGEKAEFTIDFTKYLPATTPAEVSEYRVHIVFFDRAGNRLASKSNEVSLFRLQAHLAVTGYQRFEGNFDAHEPPTDAFIRAKITNQGQVKYEGGGHFEFYAKKGNAAPTLIGSGQIPAIEPGQTQTVFAVRPVADWDQTDATSQYTYECKLVP